jgi:hypothetical protein
VRPRRLLALTIIVDSHQNVLNSDHLQMRESERDRARDFDHAERPAAAVASTIARPPTLVHPSFQASTRNPERLLSFERQQAANLFPCR